MMQGVDRTAATEDGAKVVLLTREYPPEVYGGAGVHVEYLARELARLGPVEVRCFGKPRDAPGVRAYEPLEAFPPGSPLGVVSVNLQMVDGLDDASLVHSHTWYANLAGHLAKAMYGIPHVATTHSLEPLRPWKAEQLGQAGYALSRFCERTGLVGADAVVAVSTAMRNDLLRVYPAVDPTRVHVIHNGIDAGEYAPDPSVDAIERYGVDPRRPSVLFVGRITRQKGITHLLDAAAALDQEVQLVLLAGSPDTAELAREVSGKVDALRGWRDGVVWIRDMLPRREVIQFFSHASVFCCPSIYEPLGIVNLEAMACETPVVATAVGGIPEVVEDGRTGLLVPFDQLPDGAPADPAALAAGLTERLTELLRDPDRARAMGRLGREHVLDRFAWSAVARPTSDVYRLLLDSRPEVTSPSR
jgi:starch synthase